MMISSKHLIKNKLDQSAKPHHNTVNWTRTALTERGGKQNPNHTDVKFVSPYNSMGQISEQNADQHKRTRSDQPAWPTPNHLPQKPSTDLKLYRK